MYPQGIPTVGRPRPSLHDRKFPPEVESAEGLAAEGDWAASGLQSWPGPSRENINACHVFSCSFGPQAHVNAPSPEDHDADDICKIPASLRTMANPSSRLGSPAQESSMLLNALFPTRDIGT